MFLTTKIAEIGIKKFQADQIKVSEIIKALTIGLMWK